MSLWETLFGYSPRTGSSEYMRWGCTSQPDMGPMQQRYEDLLSKAARQYTPARKMVAGDLDADHPFPQSPDGQPYRRQMVEGDL